MHTLTASCARFLVAAASLLTVMALVDRPARAATSAQPAIAAAPVLEDHYPARKVAFPAGVTGLPDLVYAQYSGFRPQILDLYLPAARGKALHPLVVYVHGGGWVGGHTRQAGAFADFPAVLASLAARGYVVASVEYRLSGEAPAPAQIQDLKAAIRWLRVHASEYGIDANQVALWGGSAGGHLAALAGTSCGAAELEPPGDRAVSDCAQAVATWYGIFDVAPIATSPAIMSVLACGTSACDPEKVRMASPVRYLDAGDPPFLLIHGEDDMTVAVSQSRDFHAALQRVGVRDELLVIPEVDHSFIGKSPEATRAATLQALKKTFEFFDATVGAHRSKP